MRQLTTPTQKNAFSIGLNAVNNTQLVGLSQGMEPVGDGYQAKKVTKLSLRFGAADPIMVGLITFLATSAGIGKLAKWTRLRDVREERDRQVQAVAVVFTDLPPEQQKKLVDMLLKDKTVQAGYLVALEKFKVYNLKERAIRYLDAMESDNEDYRQYGRRQVESLKKQIDQEQGLNDGVRVRLSETLHTFLNANEQQYYLAKQRFLEAFPPQYNS